MSEIVKYAIHARRLKPKKIQRFPSMLKNSFNFKWIKGIFDMKKIGLILFVILILIVGCKQEVKDTTKKIQLSELQISACNSADAANTCDTRLAEVGIVLKEDCCRELGKCC